MDRENIKLSIITPYYKTLEHTKRLAEVLEPQLTEDVEWIIIDDGCHEKELDTLKAKVIHLSNNSGAAGKPRNIGLDIAKGKYIGFIDSDDMVESNYIEQILKRIKYNKDIIYISWRSKKHSVVIDKKTPRWNCAVWCRVIKKSVIGNIRFKEDMKIAEDFLFVRLLKPQSSTSIKKQIYIYNVGREGSLTNG